MSRLSPLQIIGGHVTQAQRNSLRYAAIKIANQGTPEESHYLIAAFGDEKKALAYAYMCQLDTGYTHIVQPLNL